MLTIKQITEDTDKVIRGLEKKHFANAKETIAQVIELIREKRDVRLLVEVETGVRLAKYAPGRIEFEPAPGAAPDLAARLSLAEGEPTAPAANAGDLLLF